MGFFDFLTKGKDAKQGGGTSSGKDIARLTRIVGSKLSQDYDRQDAIAQLSQLASEEGARALLRRFDFSMEPTITDQEEKQAAADGVVAAGRVALDPLRDYILKAESVTWPIKVLRQIVSTEELVTELVDLLDHFDTEYVRNPEPKIQLINALEEHSTEEVRDAISPFIQDVNENVRFHAVGTLFAVSDEQCVPLLIDALVEEESLRVKNRIATGIEQRRWSMPEALRERCASALPDTFILEGDQLQRVG